RSNVSIRYVFFIFARRRRHTRSKRDWSSDVCSSDLDGPVPADVCERMRNAICKINTAVEGEAVTAKSLREAAGLGSRQYFASTVIKPLLEGGYIERSIPDKPQHPKQGYFLTQKGWLVREAYRLTSEGADM